MLDYGQFFFAEAIPDLLPVESPLPPAFWEQPRVIWALAGLVAMSVVLWWIWRRDRAGLAVAPAIAAREALRDQPAGTDSRSVAVAVLRVLRRYLPAVLNWPGTELTVDEMVLRIQADERVSSALKVELAGLLRECEQWQFSDVRREHTSRLADRALDMVEQIEVIGYPTRGGENA
jgi:hypothetical protein